MILCLILYDYVMLVVGLCNEWILITIYLFFFIFITDMEEFDLFAILEERPAGYVPASPEYSPTAPIMDET